MRPFPPAVGRSLRRALQVNASVVPTSRKGTLVFEFHGWAVVRHDTYLANDQAQQALESALMREIEKAGQAENWMVRRQNSQTTLLMSGLSNRRNRFPVDTLRWLARNGAGSYGLLYVHDDEAEPEEDNAFRVWRLARGSVDEQPDSFLSPCIPRIEDPYDARREEQ